MEQNVTKSFYSDIYPHLRFIEDVSLEADGDATVKLITKTINTYSHSAFIKYCVAVLNSISKDEFEFCKKLFDLTNRLVRYRMDPEGHEIVFTPLLLILVGKGDCKKITTWICSVLKCKGIVSADKVVNYDKPFRWQHIYAIAWPKGYTDSKGYLVLDPVNYEMFNAEVSYRIGRVNFYDGTYSRLIMSKLSMMGNVPGKDETFLGLGSAAEDFLGDVQDISGMRRNITAKHMHHLEQQYINGVYDEISGPDDDMSGLDEIGKKDKKARKAHRAANHARRKEKRKKIFKSIKKVGFAPVRAAFLVVLGASDYVAKHTKIKFNLAAAIAKLWQKDHGASITALWERFGGKKESLKKALIKHSHTQINGGIYGVQMNNGNGIAGPEAVIIAAVTAAAPILIGVIKLLHDKSVLKKKEAMEAVDATEHLEDAGTTPEGALKAEVMNTIKSNLPIVDKVMELDAGGNKQAQEEIKKSVTPNDIATPDVPPAQGLIDPAKGNHGGADGSGKDDPDNQGKQQQQQSQQQKTADTQTHSGFNLLGASSWLTGSIYFQIITEAQGINGMLTQSVGVIMLTVSIYLFTKQK